MATGLAGVKRLRTWARRYAESFDLRPFLSYGEAVHAIALPLVRRDLRTPTGLRARASDRRFRPYFNACTRQVFRILRLQECDQLLLHLHHEVPAVAGVGRTEQSAHLHGLLVESGDLQVPGFRVPVRACGKNALQFLTNGIDADAIAPFSR